MSDTKFRVGDRVLCTDSGAYGNVTCVDTSQVGEYDDGTIWYEVLFDNGEQTFLIGEDLELTDVDKKTAFLMELKELLEKYDAKIVIPLLDYDTLGFPDVNVEITLGEAESQINICYPCMKEKSITPSNIFDYDK